MIHTSSNFEEARFIVNWPPKLSQYKNVSEICTQIIEDMEPVNPPGYEPDQPVEIYVKSDPDLNTIKERGGAYGILLALSIDAGHPDVHLGRNHPGHTALLR